MPHRPASKNYEVWDDWLAKHTKSEVLIAKDWNPKQLIHIDQFFEKQEPETIAEKPVKKTRKQIIQELEEKERARKLTVRERKALKNLRVKRRREERKMKKIEKRLKRRK